MEISLVVAMSDNAAIGQAGQLPWHLPNDLKYFKSVTMGKPIIMGRTTYESIGKPLPGRTNIVLTQNKSFQAPGCVVLHDKTAVVDYCEAEKEIMIVGGAQIYQLFLADITKLYITKVHTSIKADTYFPKIDFSKWQEIERQEYKKDDKHAFDYSFITFIKR